MMGSPNHNSSESHQVTGERNRGQRSLEEKRAIVEESLQPGASVQEVAQAHGVHSSLVFKWRRLYRNGLLGNTPAATLLPVHVKDEVKHDHERPSSKLETNPRGTIYIEFARARVSIEGIADDATVRAVLECLAE
jgi:transposase